MITLAGEILCWINKSAASYGKDSPKGIKPARKKPRGKKKKKKSDWLYVVIRILWVPPLTLLAVGKGRRAVDGGLWVMWGFISSPCASRPRLLQNRRGSGRLDSVTSALSLPNSRGCDTTAEVVPSQLPLRGFGEVWVVESSIKPSSILMLSRFCWDILMVNPSTVWTGLQQVEVTQLDLKLWLWEDKISPCGWVGIYKFVPKEAEIGTDRRGLRLKPIPNISQFHLKSRLSEVQLEIHKKTLISFPPTPEVLTTTESKERIS